MMTDEEIDVFLEHYGVKGMKWGVRRKGRAALLTRVGKGEGTFKDKVRAGANVSGIDLIRGRGFKGAAALKGERLQQRTARVEKGQGTATDLLLHYGSTRLSDLVPTRA